MSKKFVKFFGKVGEDVDWQAQVGIENRQGTLMASSEIGAPRCERRSPRRVAGCGGDDSEMEGSGGTRLLAAAAEGAVAVDAAAGSVNGGGEVRLAAVPGGALGASDGVGNGPARSK